MPLFKGYIFVRAAEARRREMHFVRNLRQPRYLLASGETLWTCPAEIISNISRLEKEGAYDEADPSLGDKVRLRGTGALSVMDLLVASLDEKTAQILTRFLAASARR